VKGTIGNGEAFLLLAMENQQSDLRGRISALRKKSSGTRPGMKSSISIKRGDYVIRRPEDDIIDYPAGRSSI